MCHNILMMLTHHPWRLIVNYGLFVLLYGIVLYKTHVSYYFDNAYTSPLAFYILL